MRAEMYAGFVAIRNLSLSLSPSLACSALSLHTHMCAEMYAGFVASRTNMPMNTNIVARAAGAKVSASPSVCPYVFVRLLLHMPGGGGG
jgi:hypothetical protein